MTEDRPFTVPESFVLLYRVPGRIKLAEPREVVEQRYELCEDLAQMLVDTARSKLWELGITERDVLERLQRGVLDSDLGLDAAHARWVMRRLAELLGWDAASCP
jgi:hypothetical protein